MFFWKILITYSIFPNIIGRIFIFVGPLLFPNSKMVDFGIPKIPSFNIFKHNHERCGVSHIQSFHDFKVSKFQNFELSKLQCFNVTTFKSSIVSNFQTFKVPDIQKSNISKVRSFKRHGFSESWYIHFPRIQNFR